LSFDESLCSSDLITVLSHFGVSKVNLPIRLSARRDSGNGATNFVENETELTLSQGEIFRADPTLSIVKS
jgi:hypothetical protein